MRLSHGLGLSWGRWTDEKMEIDGWSKDGEGMEEWTGG